MVRFLPVCRCSRWSVGVRERGADLVGKQNRHLELDHRWADDAGRGSKHKVTVDNAALSDDEADQLIRWKPVALDIDAVSAAGHEAVVVEAGFLRARTGSPDEPALIDAQDRDDLMSNVVDQSLG